VSAITDALKKAHRYTVRRDAGRPRTLQAAASVDAGESARSLPARALGLAASGAALLLLVAAVGYFAGRREIANPAPAPPAAVASGAAPIAPEPPPAAAPRGEEPAPGAAAAAEVEPAPSVPAPEPPPAAAPRGEEPAPGATAAAEVAARPPASPGAAPPATPRQTGQAVGEASVEDSLRAEPARSSGEAVGEPARSSRQAPTEASRRSPRRDGAPDAGPGRTSARFVDGATYTGSVETPTGGRLTLTGITIFGQKSLAMLSGSLVETGAEVEGFQVVRIERQQVALRYGDATIFLKLP